MEIKIIASGSNGNCYLITGIYERLLVECGIKINSIKKALDFDFSKIKYCLLSHEHEDHSEAVKDIQKLGIKVVSGPGTFETLNLEKNYFSITDNKIETKEFIISSFDVEHDSNEPKGFLIFNKLENKKILFLTDTYFCKYRFKDIDCFMIEVNYLEDILNENITDGIVHPKVAYRVRESHFSLKNAIKFLKISSDKKTKKIIPIHLSSQNSDMFEIKKQIEKEVGVEVVINQKIIEV